MTKTLDDLPDGPIILGHEALVPLGFTTARFFNESIIWKKGKAIYLTHVRTRFPGSGHLRHMIHGMLLDGYTIKLRNPYLVERQFCEANGFYEATEQDPGGERVTVFILQPEGSAMACPTCDHTMQAIDRAVWWCPRCGTIRQTTVVEQRAVGVPALVERVTEFAETLPGEQKQEFERLGIRESITVE